MPHIFINLVPMMCHGHSEDPLDPLRLLNLYIMAKLTKCRIRACVRVCVCVRACVRACVSECDVCDYQKICYEMWFPVRLMCIYVGNILFFFQCI